jgi:hypothetical protein
MFGLISSIFSFLFTLAFIVICIIGYLIATGKADLTPVDGGCALDISKSALKPLPSKVAEALEKQLQSPQLADLPLKVHFKEQSSKLISGSTLIAIFSVIAVIFIAAGAVLFYFYGYKQNMFGLFEEQKSVEPAGKQVAVSSA